MTLAMFEALVDAAGANARALMTIAYRARRTAWRGRAIQVAANALALAPGDPALAAIARAIRTANVPKWHFPMMRDAPRNAAYAAAIARAVQPGMRVLDIGAGSGLLSMMAARAGAGEVVGCELDPVIAEVAREVVAANGLDGQVTILNRHSTAIDAQSDLGGGADVIVSEILGKDLVCEGVLPSLRDAAQRLLKPGGRMIPAAGHIRVALAEWPRWDDAAVGEECGFDLFAFNRLLPPGMSVAVGDPTLQLRSEAATLLSFDFSATEGQMMAGVVELAGTGGRVNGVVQWIGLQMDERGWFENRPHPCSTSSWVAVFHGFTEPLDVQTGDRVRIAGRVIDDRLLVWRDDPP